MKQRRHIAIHVAGALVLIATLIMLPSWAGASPDTVTLRPNANGDESGLTGSDADQIDNYLLIDEATSDDDTTYVSVGNTDTYLTDLYNVADTTVSGKGKINSVTVYIHVRAGNTPTQASAYTRIKTNGFAYDGTALTITTTYATYNTAYTTNPQSGNEWTWAEVNALQAGVALRRPTTTGPNKWSRATQVWVVVDYTPATLESYDDGIQSNVWGTVGDPYASETSTTTAFIYGPNFIASHGYSVAYFDNAGTKVTTDSVTSAADNTLSSQYLLTTDSGAIPGTWYAVVFDNDLGSPPATYAECAGAAGYMVEDSFEVSESAIPEFPTVMAAIGVAGLCFGIYYRMRKKRLAYVKA